jgi:hypothetical protein
MLDSIFLARTSRICLSILAFLLVSAGFIFFFPALAFSAQVSLAWDSAMDADVAGYRVYYGTSPQSYQSKQDAENSVTITISNLQDRTPYYFAVTAYDLAGNESEYSSEICYSAPSTCPFAISPLSQSMGAAGGVGTISISTGSGCTWTAVKNVSWVIITSNGSGTGKGEVSYSVSANVSASPRAGTMTIADQTFTVTQPAAMTQYTLNTAPTGAGAGGLTNEPAGTTFDAGAVVTLTATPDENSTFAGWSGGCSGTSLTCRVSMNSDASVTASFALKTYTITASAESNGSISPSGPITVNDGGSRLFTFSPNRGYRIAHIKVDGVSVGRPSTFLFGNIRGNHRIEALFVPLHRFYRR